MIEIREALTLLMWASQVVSHVLLAAIYAVIFRLLLRFSRWIAK